MEFIVFTAVVIGILVLFFIVEGVRQHKRKKEFRKNLYKRNPKTLHKKHTPERFARIDGFFKNHTDENAIDDITWNDLEMDLIFQKIDTTMCASGEEYFYYRLRTPVTSKEELGRVEDDVKYFMENDKSRVEVQEILHDQGSTGKYSLCDYLKYITGLENQSNVTHIVADLLLIVSIVLIICGNYLGVWGVILIICYNMYSYFKYKGDMNPYLISIQYMIRMMDTCKKLLNTDDKVCQKQREELKQYLSEIKSIGSYGMLCGQKTGIGSDNPAELFGDYLKMVLHLDIIAFNIILKKIKSHVKEIETLFACVGYYDYVIAIGNYRVEMGENYCIPNLLFDEGKENISLRIEEGYHPLIKDPVKNSFETNKGMLITGSNASGKSTFLKMVAINTLLAQTIHTCTAKRYEAPVFRILSSMSLRDDLGSGESYYMVEIKAIRRILEKCEEAGAPILCFVDEVLRGTNTVERIAASTEILKSLSGENAICMAATHDIELTFLLEKDYDNYHFDEQIMDDDIYFSYQLKEGRSTTHNAISLLKLIGYSEKITKNAKMRAEQFAKTGNWD